MNIKKNLDSKEIVLSKSIQKVMIMVLIAATILTATAGLTSCNKQGSAKSAEQLVDEIENYYAEKGNEFELQEISLTKVGDFHYGLFFSELKEDGLVLKSANYDISEKFYNRTNDEYKLKENEENFELENMIVTDTQTTITYKGEKIDIIKGIVDNNGNLYKRGTVRYLDNQYSTNCSFYKSMETTPLYLRIEVNGEIKDIELEKVNE